MTWAGYADRWSEAHGGYDPRRASPLVRGWLFLAYRVSRLLVTSPVSPNAVTALGLALSIGVPVLVGVPSLAGPGAGRSLAGGAGWALAAAALVVTSALADTVDGALAVISDRSSRLGQLYDAVADRIAEACWLVALALAGAPVWLVALCGGLAWLHEYVRARATVGGMSEIGAVTVAERPTRVLVVTFGLAAAGVGGLVREEWAAVAVTVATAVWASLGMIAMVQLVTAVRRALRP